MKSRFEKQLDFLVEADKMKTILRQTILVDKSKRENDAEHSWHFALMAMILFEYADQEKVNILRVLKMALIHDLVEIYAGDTFAYDEKGGETKEIKETQAAEKLFSLLPEDQAEEIKSLWLEFDLMESDDAKYAAAIDRLQPFINNYMTDGHTWRLHKVSASQVYKRMDTVRTAAPELWPFVTKVINEGIEKGQLQNK